MEYIGDRGSKANSLIREYIENDKIFSLSRIGLAEVRWVDWYLRGGLDSNCDGHMWNGNIFTPTLRHRMDPNGIYGDCGEEFFSEYNNGISTADLQVFWFNYDGQPLVYDEQVNIFNNLSPNSIKVDCEVLAPYRHTEFWTKSLKGKKVLVVYPFVETIKMQYEKRNLIWTGEHEGKLPDFELITYKPVWTLAGCRPHSSWKESLDFMKDEISKLDFDFAILGCSHYGIPLVSFIKENLKKSAIYMGGELQILFGIKGARWDQWERVTNHYNEHWTRTIDEIPNGHTIMDGGCYW